jgi:hypothetical protein
VTDLCHEDKEPVMKMRITILTVCAVLALLLLATLVNASPGSTARSSTLAGVLSGGHYQLITTSVPVNALANGGSYRLMMSSASIVDPAAGCCCKTNLPCVLK